MADEELQYAQEESEQEPASRSPTCRQRIECEGTRVAKEDNSLLNTVGQSAVTRQFTGGFSGPALSHINVRAQARRTCQRTKSDKIGETIECEGTRVAKEDNSFLNTV